jgi:hypothetical protein
VCTLTLLSEWISIQEWNELMGRAATAAGLACDQTGMEIGASGPSLNPQLKLSAQDTLQQPSSSASTPDR